VNVVRKKIEKGGGGGGGADISHHSRLALGPTCPPVQCVPAVFRGNITAGTWR